MDIELILFIITAVLLDLLILAYAGKHLLALWKKITADGKITADELVDAAEEVIELVKDTVDKLDGEEE
jgi:hypothetical protein